jgi:signal transduction histidine kinase
VKSRRVEFHSMDNASLRQDGRSKLSEASPPSVVTAVKDQPLFARDRAAELANANDALRSCLDALASVPELDEFLGQVMGAMARQLGAESSALRLCNFERNTLSLELVFQDGRVMTPSEVNYPTDLRSYPIDDPQHRLWQGPAVVRHHLDGTTSIPGVCVPGAARSYLLSLGVKTSLTIPLKIADQRIGVVAFRFTEDRSFRPEDLEIARALATQASLAIQLTRLARDARQSAVLTERNRLAGEIHDSLAQTFVGISMQLDAAEAAGSKVKSLPHLQRANELARFGLAEARRSVLSLRSGIHPAALVEALQQLVERSSVPGLLRCELHSDEVPEGVIPPDVQHELVRICQEAISNAVRHAKPTVIATSLRWTTPNLTIQVTDNGSGITAERLSRGEGFGMANMRARIEKVGGKLDIETAPGRGTSIVVRLPIQGRV